MRACVCALWVGWSVGGWSGRGTFLNQREGEKKEEEATRMRMGVEEGMEWGVESGVLMMMKREGGRRRGGGGSRAPRTCLEGPAGTPKQKKKGGRRSAHTTLGVLGLFFMGALPGGGVRQQRTLLLALGVRTCVWEIRIIVGERKAIGEQA